MKSHKTLFSLAVEVVILLIVEVPLSRSVVPLAVGKSEVVSESSGLLKSLAEHFVLLDIIIRHRPDREESLIIS